MTDRSDRAGGDGRWAPDDLEALAYRAIREEAEQRCHEYVSSNRKADALKSDVRYWIARVALSKHRASPPSGNAGEGAEFIEAIEPIALEISGPYHYQNDVHPCLRIAAPGRILASLFIVDGDEDRAFAEASMIKETFRLGGKEVDRIHYAAAAPPQPAPDALRMRKALQWISDQNDCDASAVQVSDLCLVAKNALSSAPVQSGVRGDREAIARTLFKNRSKFDDKTTEEWFCLYAENPKQLGEQYLSVWWAYSDADAILSLQSTGDQRTPQVSGDGSR